MTNSLRAIIAAAVMATGVTQAYAAQVQPQGQVTLNGGAIFETVTAPPGSTVRVSSGSARIYYDNGCTEVVNAYESRVVQTDPVCNTGTTGYDQVKGPFFLAGTGIIVGVVAWQLSRDKDDDPVSP
jgi:hypothetical protein